MDTEDIKKYRSIITEASKRIPLDIGKKAQAMAQKLGDPSADSMETRKIIAAKLGISPKKVWQFCGDDDLDDIYRVDEAGGGRKMHKFSDYALWKQAAKDQGYILKKQGASNDINAIKDNKVAGQWYNQEIPGPGSLWGNGKGGIAANTGWLYLSGNNQINELSPETVDKYATAAGQDLAKRRNHAVSKSDPRDSENDAMDPSTQGRKRGLGRIEKKTGQPALSSVPMPAWKKNIK